MGSDSTVSPTFNSLGEAILNYTWAGGKDNLLKLIREFKLSTVEDHGEGDRLAVKLSNGTIWCPLVGNLDDAEHTQEFDAIHNAFKDMEDRFACLITEVEIYGTLSPHVVTELLSTNIHLLTTEVHSRRGVNTITMTPPSLDELKSKHVTIQDILNVEVLIRPMITTNVDVRWSKVKPCKHCNKMYFYTLKRSTYCSEKCRMSARRWRG